MQSTHLLYYFRIANTVILSLMIVLSLMIIPQPTSVYAQQSVNTESKNLPNKELNHKHRQRPKAIRPLKRLRRHLIPPRMIARHQERLGLNPEQKKQLKEIMTTAKAKLIQLKAAKQAQEASLMKLVQRWEKSHSIDDEKALLESLKRFKEAEHSWREERLLTALKARRILTKEQLKQARQLKKKRALSDTQRAHKRKMRMKHIDRLNRLEKRIESLENTQ